MTNKRGSGGNCFDNDLLRLYYDDFEPCVWCGQNGADCFDHVISRKNMYTSSILNASPTHNQKCNIAKHGEMHTRENQMKMLEINFRRLHKEKYKLKEIDWKFIQEYNLLELVKGIL